MTTQQPRNTKHFEWTMHVVSKMKQYNLSESRVKRIINNPQRIEHGVAPKTIAVMQPNSSKHSYEFWAMYQTINPKPKSLNPKKIRIITAWKYPGKSPIRGPIPVPEDIWEELSKIK
ncbi:MAG TPA: hypothetical protein PLF70_00915 [Candidatus Portnoybacteria bacterium]|jgi:hypothetical protein|nr:hypothetical protein [Candidatus Portnoybacteria bacterium]MDD5752174.1 hypothetical protein [Candidatus Portnoybacteria bacterium]HNU97000.1 hypothetical protein [Candidatus Portnoybacteria bacterium]HOZ16430.1 hypothetical protein [Candidatus Portnoybacteria bacterium]HPH52138.1 hypothetical protein [Candidatus Portnoybacteria bacterium]